MDPRAFRVPHPMPSCCEETKAQRECQSKREEDREENVGLAGKAGRGARKAGAGLCAELADGGPAACLLPVQLGGAASVMPRSYY